MRHRTFQTFCRFVWRSVRLLLVTLVVLLFGRQASAQVIRVDIDSTTNGPGSTWANAYDNLQDALDFAKNNPESVTEIWVAEGTYKPDASSQSVSFDLTTLDPEEAGLSILGGFDATETAAEDRHPFTNITILSGDLSGNDTGSFGNRTDNSYHVITASDVSDSVLVDGFTIKAGNAVGGTTDNYGGGAYISYTVGMNPMHEVLGPRFNNCIFVDNFATTTGGAVYGTNVALNLRKCTIKENKATNGGGVGGDGAILRHCNIKDNEATSLGGGVYLTAKNNLLHCDITDNVAGSNGGGMYGSGHKPDLVSCYVARNESGEDGGGLYVYEGNGVCLTNCAFVENYADSDGGGGVF